MNRQISKKTMALVYKAFAEMPVISYNKLLESLEEGIS